MTATTVSAAPHADSEAGFIEQLYLTHCLYGEGNYQQAGFNIRACSSDDALLHRFAVEYPHYVLPAGIPSAQLLPENAPRRLALVHMPGGKNALIHSVYLPEQNRGRANNFFSHVLVYDAIQPCRALTAWGSSAWATSCDPGQSNDLRGLEELPAPGPINDDAVTAFLQERTAVSDVNLATLTCPPRLDADRQRRRELLRFVLRGCQLVLDKSPAATRSRFYILAEPGLTALLLYAAARLLPNALSAKLTFSTYEHARRDLRSYRHARVVGTYLAQPAEGLDEQFYTVHGYALDTFKHQCSPELSSAARLDIDEWIDLAAAGDWHVVGRIHGLMGKKNVRIISVGDAIQAFTLSQRLASGDAKPEELLAARAASWGPAILGQYQDVVWPVVRDGSLKNTRLREEFADLLAEHSLELEQRAASALRASTSDEWQAHWQLLQFVLRDKPAKLWEVIPRLLPESPYPAGSRVVLLQALQGSAPCKPVRKTGCQRLLRDCSNEDLAQLAGSTLDRRWFVRALCYALLHPDTVQDAVRHLHEGDDDMVGLFWEQFRQVRKERQRRLLLAPLFPPSEDGKRFLSRALKCGCTLRPKTWTWLLDRLAVFSGEWNEFWTSENLLGRLLNLIKASGEEAAPLWQRLSEQLNDTLLIPGDAYQKALLMELKAIMNCPASPLPPEAAARIVDWSLLRDHVERAVGASAEERPSIMAACERRSIDPVELLTKYFQQFIVPRRPHKELLDDFLGFFHSFCPSEENYQSHGCRLIWWLQIVENYPEQSGRAFYQRYYLDQHVPFEFRWRLAQETYHAGKLFPGVFEHFAKPTETSEAHPDSAVPVAGSVAYSVISRHAGKAVLFALFVGGICGVVAAVLMRRLLH